ncbi:hypothetical protein NC651_019204 [Populus alba x Populus x berolinensis]|nr:hypothetical protein NC651_019204 [Populus alba x Populus x berolinensis]
MKPYNCILKAPKKEKAPPPSSKPAKSGGGKQKKEEMEQGKAKGEDYCVCCAEETRQANFISGRSLFQKAFDLMCSTLERGKDWIAGISVTDAYWNGNCVEITLSLNFSYESGQGFDPLPRSTWLQHFN